MARRGGRRGRRSRSRQNRSRRTSSRRTSSRRTSTRRSTPSSRRNSPSNRRATTSRKRQATRTTTRRAAPKRSAPTTRRTPTRNTRGSGISQSRKNIGRNVGTRIKKTVGRITRPPSASAKTTTSTRSAFNKQLKNIQAVNKPTTSFGPVKDGATYAKNITNYNMKYGKTPAIRAKAYEQTLSGRKGLFDDATSGSGPVASGDAYARGLETSRFGSPMNIGKTILNTIPGVNFRLQNDKELADSVGRAPTLTRRRSGGGSSRIEQQVAATQMQPEIAPTIGQPIEETGQAPLDYADSSALTRIQNQAYNTQLTSSLANMFGGQGSVGYTPQADMALSPTLRAGQSRGRRRVKLFGGRARRGGTGDQFSRAGDRIARLTNINV